jgi:hypothetical protein
MTPAEYLFGGAALVACLGIFVAIGANATKTYLDLRRLQKVEEDRKKEKP